MSDFLSDLYTNVADLIYATWLDIKPTPRRNGTDAHGIWEVEHVRQVPWSDLTPPYAVIAIDTVQSTDWGGTNDAYLPLVEVYYVAEVDGPVSGIRSQLMTLRRAFNTADQTKLDVQRVRDMVWSDALVPNQVFSSKGMAHRAGRLTVEILTGEPIDGPD